jgi:pSer/pThr/pTyr-binding forkhead associated (FHA) protein
LGRDNSADVILDDPGISRRHTEIRVTSDGPHLVASIRDLGSTNGTFVNGERITSQHLSDGDRVNVGRTALTFRGEHR